MVRFAWHVEDGLNAFMLPGAYNNSKEGSVRHAACEIEIPYSKETLTSCLTLPADYLDSTKTKSTGVILAHGSNAAEWKGKLLNEVANMLAAEGYVVMRYCCRQKEQRRQKMFEKALDACATSPFARGITQWVLAGYGSGARIAAGVGTRCRGNIAGFVFISYPLTEVLAAPPSKSRRGEGDIDDPPALNTSAQPLKELEKPLLFLVGDSDKLCPLEDLSWEIKHLPSPDIRVEVFEDANGEFRVGQGKNAAPASLFNRLCNSISDFVQALDTDSMQDCQLKRPEVSLPAAKPPAASTPLISGTEDVEMQDREAEARPSTPPHPESSEPAKPGQVQDDAPMDSPPLQRDPEEQQGSPDDEVKPGENLYADVLPDSSRVSNPPRSMLSTARESANIPNGIAPSESFAASYQPAAARQLTASSLGPAASSHHPPHSQHPSTSSQISHHSRGDYAEASPRWAQSIPPSTAYQGTALDLRSMGNNIRHSEPLVPFSTATNQQSRNQDGPGMSHHDSAMPGCDKADNFLRYDQHSATGANVAEHPRDWANLAGRLQSNESLITNGTQSEIAENANHDGRNHGASERDL